MRRYLILVLIIAFAGFFLQLPRMKNTTKTVFLFPSKVIHGTLNGIGDFFSFLRHAKKVDEENFTLHEQLLVSEAQNSLFRARISEMERMRKYESLPSRFLLSNVIARDPSNWFKAVCIDKGENSGVSINMVALLPDGVVGRTIEVSPSSSTVLLAIDRGSKIAAIVRETRELGVAEGTENFILMNFFTRDIQAKPGDTVLTSGLGGTFPKGLVLGKITGVGKAGLVAKADIESAVDFNKLEEMLILLQ